VLSSGRPFATVAELVIFDCDGLLVDSDRISLRIQAERISALGLEMSYEECVRDFLGLGMPATLRILTERLGRPLPERWEAELDAAVRDGFRRELTPVPGIVEALEGIESPACVASSGSHEKMRLTLGLTGLWDRFAGRIFSADEVKRGKPAPDLFLHAASRIVDSAGAMHRRRGQPVRHRRGQGRRDVGSRLRHRDTRCTPRRRRRCLHENGGLAGAHLRCRMRSAV